MPIRQLYHTWNQKMKELRPGEHRTRRRNFAWLLAGLILARSVHQSRIAVKLPRRTKLLSRVRRLGRLLANRAIQVRKWYGPIAKGLVKQMAVVGPVRLILDGSKVGSGHQLLLVAWTWAKGSKGHSSVPKQVALLQYVRTLISPESDVLLVGDSEFGTGLLQKQLQAWKWDYVLRQKGRYLVKPAGQSMAQRLADLVDKPGQRV